VLGIRDDEGNPVRDCLLIQVGSRAMMKHFPAKHETLFTGDGGGIVLCAGRRENFGKDGTGPLNAVHSSPLSGQTDSPVQNTEGFGLMTSTVPFVYARWRHHSITANDCRYFLATTRRELHEF